MCRARVHLCCVCLPPQVPCPGLNQTVSTLPANCSRFWFGALAYHPSVDVFFINAAISAHILRLSGDYNTALNLPRMWTTSDWTLPWLRLLPNASISFGEVDVTRNVLPVRSPLHAEGPLSNCKTDPALRCVHNEPMNL